MSAIDNAEVNEDNKPEGNQVVAPVADNRELLRFYRNLGTAMAEAVGLTGMTVTDAGFSDQTHELTPPARGEEVEEKRIFDTTFLKYDDAALQIDGKGRVETLITTDGTIELDYDGGSTKVESFKRDGTKHYMKDGTFHYKDDDGKEIDTGISEVYAARDGSFITKSARTGALEIVTRDGATHTLAAARAAFDSKGNLTIERSDGSKEILTKDRTLIEIDARGRVAEIIYANGERRRFAYDGSTLTGIQEPGGKIYTRENGEWIGPDGRPTGWSNAFVAADATFSYLDSGGEIQVTEASGKLRSVDVDDLGDDAALYPDAERRRAEIRRIEAVIREKGELTGSGRTIIADLEKLGLDEVDIWHGSHVVVGGDGLAGDGGLLYERWKELDGAKSRTSSHASSDTQYQIKVGPDDAVILFGRTENGDTWFQLERHPGRTGSLFSKIVSGGSSFVGNLADFELSFNDAHGDDYELYKKIRQNIGPYGVSPHSDRNPVRLEWMES